MPGPNDPATTRALARVGSVLRGKWRLDKLLGVGGMAAVYVATHRNGQRGAVKMLHADLAGDEDSQRRFLREGYAANAVGHAGAVSVLDDDVAEDGSVFLVMELLSGRTVDDLADSRAGARLEPGEVLAIADQLLDVLAAAHEKGIVHRDLKPENLFITEAGQIKVLDFGLARFADATHARLTSTGAAPMGTPAFMPPEQARGEWESVDAQSDVWAVGATMFTLLTGRIVHDENNFQRLMASAMLKPAPLVATIDPSVPPPLAAIVDRALAFEKRDRWSDARTMRDAVREARTTIRAELGRPGADPAFFDERTTGLRISPPQIAAAAPAAVPVRSQVRTSTLGATATTPKVPSSRRGALIGGAFVVVAFAGAALALHFVRGHAESATNATTPSSAPHSQGAASTTAAKLAATADAEAKSGGTPVPSATTTVAASASPESSVRPVVTSPHPVASVGRGDPKTPPSSGGAPPPKPTGSPSSDPMGKW